MRITIAAVGRARNAPEDALCDLYCERARGLGTRLGFAKLDLAIVETSKAATVKARIDDEAAKLRQRLAIAAHSIVLDEGGKSMDSEKFAAHLARLRDSGIEDLAFVIGGPDGLAPTLRDTARERLAFGAQTWPHLMVRAMLAEQLYRAFAILSGHPYHRGRPA